MTLIGMRKKILIILVLIIGLCVLVKDQVLRVYAIQYLQRSFGAKCAIAQVSVWPWEVKIKGASFIKDGVKLTLGAARLQFDISGFPRFRVKTVKLSNCNLSIEDIVQLKRMGALLSAQPRSCPVTLVVTDLRLILHNTQVKLGNVNGADIEATFSFNGKIGMPYVLVLDGLDILQFNVSSQDFSIKKLRVAKTVHNLYSLYLPSLTIKSEVLKDIELPFRLEKGRIVFLRTKNQFFGTDAYLEGVLDFSDYRNVCLQASLGKLSFSNIIKVLNNKDTVDLAGVFAGEVSVCLSPQGLKTVRVGFLNTDSGFIRIKDDSSLEFLRKYLDARSYDSLVDNFKNYAYNRGAISVDTKDGDVVLYMVFESNDMGKRDITINFHNALGGSQ